MYDLETLSPEQRKLLSTRISDWPLKIQGTFLEGLINRLYKELEQARIKFKPAVYLSDDWGCPNLVPIIGIPFHLVVPELRQIEAQLTGDEIGSEEEIMKVLRHETGHALNYAYCLFTRPEWEQVFGQFALPYIENYKPIPFNPRFVRHVPGWYVQKHPDEDFAETFAVWLTPDSAWEKIYTGTPAMAKLKYMAQLIEEIGQKEPPVNSQEQDMPLREMNMSLEEWYKIRREDNEYRVDLNPVIEIDLRRLFPDQEGQAAEEVLRSHREALVKEINHWTGINRHLLQVLVQNLGERIRGLDLKVKEENRIISGIQITAFVSTLAMNYINRGRFIAE